MSPLHLLARRLRLALAVQLGERTGLLLAADAFLLLQGTFIALIGGGEAKDFYLLTALLPLVLLGPPALADLVALERRSGSLDLTLAAGSREALFLMRTCAVFCLMWLQGSAVMIIVEATVPESSHLVASLFQLAAVSALIAGASLFWTVHLKGAGGSWLATLGTLALLGRWTLFVPVPARHADPASVGWLGLERGTLSALAILAGASLLLTAYALRRLQRPEGLLA